MEIADMSDIQAESGVIGSLIFHPEFMLNSDAFLKAGHFYNKENGCIYWAIQELYKDGITNIDAFNLSTKLQSHKGVERTIEKYNLPAAQEFIQYYKNVARHTIEEYLTLAKTITEYAFKRKLYEALIELQSKCFSRETHVAELSGAFYGKIDKLTEDFVTGNESKTLGEEIDDIFKEIISRRSENGLYGFPSKYPAFSKYFTYEKGELYIIQAKYKEGKSIFLMNEVVHKLKNDIPVLIIDTEMQTRLYVERLIAHVAQVSIQKVKNGLTSDEERQRITDAVAWIKTRKIKHIYRPDMSNDELYATCKLWIHKIGIEFLVYDYVKSNKEDSYNDLGERCDFLHNRIAGELNLVVLAACQLNRAGEVADSIKINRYLSVGIKYGQKTKEQQVRDGAECGNAYAKIYVNRIGEQMDEDDENEYIDLNLHGSTMTISEVQQHERKDGF